MLFSSFYNCLCFFAGALLFFACLSLRCFDHRAALPFAPRGSAAGGSPPAAKERHLHFLLPKRAADSRSSHRELLLSAGPLFFLFPHILMTLISARCAVFKQAAARLQFQNRLAKNTRIHRVTEQTIRYNLLCMICLYMSTDHNCFSSAINNSVGSFLSAAIFLITPSI